MADRIANAIANRMAKLMRLMPPRNDRVASIQDGDLAMRTTSNGSRSAMAPAIAKRMAILWQTVWQTDAPNPNPNPNYFRLAFSLLSHSVESKSNSSVTRGLLGLDDAR